MCEGYYPLCKVRPLIDGYIHFIRYPVYYSINFITTILTYVKSAIRLALIR